MIRQTEAAECGLACLATVANHLGQQVDRPHWVALAAVASG